MGIPAEVWKRIRDFEDHRTTGQIALNFHEGVIKSYDLKEHGACHEEKDAAGK